jgi:tRNA threonylcarbamoyladenosine biosynthesis protein TsaE
MKSKYITNSPFQTKKIGKILAKEILKKNTPKKTIILGLEGDLGGGKTTFLQGLAKGLGIKEKILSPTFIIMRRLRIPFRQTAGQFKNFYHFDYYRVSKPKDVSILGFKKIISQPKNIVAVEWADRLHKILPRDVLVLRFKFIAKNKREIKIAKK